MQLDFIALIFDAVISLENEISEDKIEAVSRILYSLNPEVFKEVREKRFHPITAIQWHPFADMTVKQFKSQLFSNLKLHLQIEQIKSNFEMLDKESLQQYTINLVKNLARQEVLHAIVDSWKTANVGIPTDEAEASVECGMQ